MKPLFKDKCHDTSNPKLPTNWHLGQTLTISPLALEPIRHLSNACRPSVKLMLALCKRLRQWVCNVIVCWYSANLHISSIDDLSNEMEASEYVFGSLVRSRLL